MFSFSSRRAIWQLPAKASQRGFTLIETALVLVVTGLAVGGTIAALGPLLENKKVRDTQESLQQASDAILTYAMVNRRIPCPATATSNGLEVLAPGDAGLRGQCANPYNGFIPARTLGMVEQGPKGLMQDPWSYSLRYAVSHVGYAGNGKSQNANKLNECVQNNPECFFPLTAYDGVKHAHYHNGSQKEPPNPGQLEVCASSTGITATNCGTAALLAKAGFVVWSTARNGVKSVLPTPTGDGPDENANFNADVVFVSHLRTDAGPNGGFDDIFRWQTMDTIISNMMKAGVLH